MTLGQAASTLLLYPSNAGSNLASTGISECPLPTARPSIGGGYEGRFRVDPSGSMVARRPAGSGRKRGVQPG